MGACGGRPVAVLGAVLVLSILTCLGSPARAQERQTLLAERVQTQLRSDSDAARSQLRISQLAESVQTQLRSDSDAARSQLRISQLADQTTELLGEYRLVLQQLDRVRIYNDNLAALVADQEAEKASIQQQLVDFVVVEQGIVPLMFSMIDALDQFVALDLPFQTRERVDRVRRLRDNMDSSEITISEKYRQIMDAYLVETDFGRTVEAYIDTLNIDGFPTQVDILRIGRVLLAYQTPDRAQTGFFNSDTRTWEPLSDDYRAAITQGLRIARRQAAPDLLRLPVHAPEASQ